MKGAAFVMGCPGQNLVSHEQDSTRAGFVCRPVGFLHAAGGKTNRRQVLPNLGDGLGRWPRGFVSTDHGQASLHLCVLWVRV